MTMSSVAELDARLGTPEFDADPHETLRRLRAEDPVHWNDAIGAWIITRFDDVLTTFRDVKHFSNEGRLAKTTEYLGDEVRAGLHPFEEHYSDKGILHSDAPDHTRLRTLVLAGFNPRVVAAMRPRIEAIVDGIFDQAAERGRLEAIGDLAWELPSTVLADLLGAPEESRPLFRDWADAVLGFQGVNKPPLAALLAAQQALLEAKDYFRELIELRRREPGDDLLSHLVAAEADGETLSERELLNTCITLLGAGQETTTALIGNGLYLLLSHPESWALLRSDPALVPTAVEEFVRYESPIPRQPRLVTEDVELGGKLLRAGDVAFQMLNSANRDPEKFDDAETFDITRTPNRHIGFGIGAHFCVGAPLSRLEGEVVFSKLVERFPGARLVDPVAHWNMAKRNSRVLERLEIAL
jgi:cytochrome P450